MKASWCIGIVAAVLIGPPRAAVAAQPPRTIQVAVTEKGVEPPHVTVTKGQPLKLVVTRKTDETCAKEIVIADENIKADLPLDKPVTLSFTPKRAGEIKYACGMNMITGVLEVASREGTDATEGSEGSERSNTDRGGGMMGGMMGNGGGMMGGGMNCCGGMMGGTMQEMSAIHRLLSNHENIQRSVKDIPNGVETVTTSSDPKLAAVIREHVGQMKQRIESGEAIRQGDPLFREIFANHEHIHMSIEDVPGGVRVKETADEPRVVPLVRQHARRAVSEFVAEGMPRAMRSTPLPPGYKSSSGARRTAGTSRMCGCSQSSL